MYRFVTQEAQLTLHDCFITNVGFGRELILSFEQGIDILASHSLNPTHRHQTTGPAEVVLQSYELVQVREVYGAEDFSPSLEALTSKRVEVLCFEFDRATRTAQLLCDIDWRYCVAYTFSCEAVYYKWNELTGDAWFQDWP